ncbi:MAG: alpha-hydroxy acid oxidase [Pseudobdellovibrionaceae bacterium]
MNKIINLNELKSLARPRLTQMAYDFIDSGAEDEITLRHNQKSWQKIEILPQVLQGISEPQLSTNVLGEPIQFPILVAPMGFQCLAHPDGEVASAKGAAQAGTIFCLSTTATKSIEEVAQRSEGSKWFQLYIYKDQALTKDLVQRAQAAGYRAICLTVDNSIEGRRERDKFNKFHLPQGLTLANFKDDSALRDIGHADKESALTTYIQKLWKKDLSWKDLEWLKSFSPLPVVIKGILTPQDAKIALDHGVSGIVVSNHGGRQLDTVPGTAKVLPQIIEAVDQRCEVLVDGGIRRGTDVFKALALGAKAVLIGRPIFWGLSVGGAEGVAEVLCHLRDELSITMQLAGCAEISKISKNSISTYEL